MRAALALQPVGEAAFGGEALELLLDAAGDRIGDRDRRHVEPVAGEIGKLLRLADVAAGGGEGRAIGIGGDGAVVVGAELLHEPAAERLPAQVGAGQEYLVVERRAVVDGGCQRAGGSAEAVAIGNFLGLDAA